MDDDEAQKRNTDCVYFLASPLTCKKGSECEYRHSETARLNPRDCWFWLGGNCLNPSCAFRHPPLDGMLEMLSDTVPSQPPSSLSINKINVACHFYFNGFCIKGSNCPFLHGSSEFLPTQNPKTASTSVKANPAVNKSSTRSEMVIGSVETAPYPTGGAAKTLCPQIQPPIVQPDVPLTKTLFHQIQPTVGHPDAPLTNTPCHQIQPTVVKPDAPLVDSTGRSPSPEASMIDEGVATKLSESPPDFVNGRSLLCPDESSEDQGNDGVEHEEWWESSPGFDVLVDDGSEQLGPEEDAKYLENHLIQYEFEDRIGFDHMEYIDAGILYKHGLYDSYDRFEGLLSDHAQKVPDDFRERFPESRLFESRRVYGWESESEQRRSVDLRNRLRKQRMMNGDQLLHSSRKRRRLYDNNRDRSRRHEMGGTIRGRLASEVGKNMIGSHSEAEHGLKENGRGWSRHSQLRLGSVRQQEKERRRRRRNAKPGKLCSEISKGLPAKEAKPRQLSQTFMGPKTLAQIKEEKRRSTGDGSKDMEHRTSQNLARLEVSNPSRVVSKDFQGPKPLHELLKHKNKPWIVSDEEGQETNPFSKEDSMPRLSKHFQGPLERRLENGLYDEDGQMVKSGTSNQFLETDDGFLDSNDDDDELAKKIAIIFA